MKNFWSVIVHEDQTRSMVRTCKVDQNYGLRAGRLCGEYSDFGLHVFALNLGWQF